MLKILEDYNFYFVINVRILHLLLSDIPLMLLQSDFAVRLCICDL